MTIHRWRKDVVKFPVMFENNKRKKEKLKFWNFLYNNTKVFKSLSVVTCMADCTDTDGLDLMPACVMMSRNETGLPPWLRCVHCSQSWHHFITLHHHQSCRPIFPHRLSSVHVYSDHLMMARLDQDTCAGHLSLHHIAATEGHQTQPPVSQHQGVYSTWLTNQSEKNQPQRSCNTSCPYETHMDQIEKERILQCLHSHRRNAFKM